MGADRGSRTCRRGTERPPADAGGQLAEQPYRWSQGWFQQPPIGTEVMLGDGLVEVHVGGGVWQTVDAGT